VENPPEEKNRVNLAEQIVQESQPISFASECFMAMRSMQGASQGRLFSVEDEHRLAKIIADRTKDSS
jgi:hypothetical protein